MNKQKFEKHYPDVCVQEATFKHVMSRSGIESFVMKLVESLETGLLGYEDDGDSVKIYTSDLHKNDLDKMVHGKEVIHPHTGEIGQIMSEKPFICGCEMCIRVQFKDSSDIYSCLFFQ